MKIPKLFKKAAAFVMAAVTALSIMPATAFAAGDIGTISFSHTYDSNGNAMRYNSSANIGGYTAGGTGNYKYRMFVDGENAFCIQPGVPLKTGNTLKKASSDTWNALSANQKKAVGLALLYGYQGNRNNLSGSDDEKWLATQTLVWEFVTGCREATGSYNQTSTTVYSLHFGSNYANSGARAVYDQIVAMLREHNTIPSFMSGGKNDITKELAYKDGKYSITLTDSNGVLSDYSFSSSDSNVSVSKSGNKLTISSTVAISGSVRITAKRNNVPTVSSSAKLIAYGDPNLQDLVTGVENADTVSAYINIETPTGTIALKKTSEDGVVEGISFTIKGDNFNKTVKTGKDGSVSVEGIFPGTYTVTEQSIDRYEPQKTQTVTLIGGKTSTVTFSNTLKRGSLEIVKTSEDNLVEGMKFHLYGTSLSGLPVDEYAVTDKNGLAKFENVLISGDTPYVVEEVDNAVRYVIPASQTAPIEWNKVTKRSFDNVLKKFQVTVTKTDAETGNTIPYAGAGFQIYDPNGNLVTMTFTYPEVTTIDTFYTTADGDLITPQTLEYGKGYSLVEVQAPYGYVLNSEPVYFDVVQENSEEESGITVIEVVRSNMAQKGTITVEKSGEVFSSVAGDKGLYQPIFSVSGLEGAVYEITAAEDIVTLDGTVRANKGEVVDTVTTEKDGTVKSKELYLGKYEVKEITAPYGMVLNEEVRSVELVYAGQNVDVTETATSFYNERQRVEIDLIKSLAIDEAYGIGKNGEIFDVTFGLYAAEELTAADGKTIPADGLIEVISLDESGHGKAISDLPMGSYYVQEISTNSAYIVSDAKYPVTFEYAGQDTETVRITANEGEAITNDIIYGSVSGKKSDEDGKALGGAVIGIFTTGTTEFTKENAIAATTSKDDGSFSFAKVPYGTWIIREIESPKGYVLSEEEIAVTIGKVDEVVEIELVNYFIKGNIALTKVDEDYPDNKLSGAVFEVYSDTNGDGKLDKDDTLLGEMKELDGGVYQMSELRYGKYLVKETKAPTGFVLDENVYSVSVEENGKTYTVENKAGVGFINAAQKGSLKIVKTSSDGKVEGFSFRVTGVDYDQTFKTDKNGEIVIEGLWIGDYTVSEVSDKASAGYILPADKQATVKVDATAIVQMHNEFRDTPKTGDDFNLGLWVSLAALSVVGAGVLGFVGYKNRKKKKED